MVIQLKYSPGQERCQEPVALPLSKSVALRVMTLNALSRRLGGGAAKVPELPDAEDVAGMARAMRAYSGRYGANVVRIGEGGAPLRFFTALAASTPGVDLTVSAGRSLMRRPLKPLIDALRAAGADIRCLRREGYPPLRIIGRRLSPRSVRLNPGISSQFVSALMMASPLWEYGMRLDFDGCRPVSAPYIAMTAEIMKRFGAELSVSDDSVAVAPGHIKAPREYEIETDWSGASYLYELALLLPGADIPLERLTPSASSLQGDARCEEIFGFLGVRTIYNADGSVVLRCDPLMLDAVRRYGGPLVLDLNATPDLVPALAVGFCVAGLQFRFNGVGHLRHKETDRMHALAVELERIGYRLTTGDDFMEWRGERTPVGEHEVIRTYSDHRMAMAFAPAATHLPYLTIDSPDVVGKSFPRYWELLGRLGFNLRRFPSA